MYQMFLGATLPLPVAPSSITTKIGNRNSTVELLDGREVNILRSAALKEFSFEFMIPYGSYPFLSVAGNIVDAVTDFLGPIGDIAQGMLRSMFISELGRLKDSKEPFHLVIVRMVGDSFSLSSIMKAATGASSEKVVIEDFEVIEDAATHGLDTVIRVHLRKYDEIKPVILDDNVKKEVRP